MNVSEKIDFLMNLTGTKNSSLGKALCFDPSYISRIRSGNRGIPKNQPFTRPVAAFFAETLQDGAQLDSASHMILGKTKLPADKEALELCLYEWLEDNSEAGSSSDPVGTFISDIKKMLDNVSSSSTTVSQFSSNMDALLTSHPNISKSQENSLPVSVYYGNSGKRKSVINFLTSLVEQKKPFNLFLYSDENMKWLVESPEFAKQWAMLLMYLMKTGSHIQIIHTINRDFYEMMEAIRKWLPLYATGSIEPFYYPLMRDNIYHRSLFIAEGDSAVISTSVGDHTEEMSNFYIKDEQAVSSLKKEYDNYFSLCKPLMKTYSSVRKGDFMQKMISDEKIHGKYMVAHPVPSLWTMPDSTASKISDRSGDDSLLKRVMEMKNDIINVLENGGNVTEFLTMPLSAIKAGQNIPIPLSDMMSDTEYYYLPEEYMENLKEMQKYVDKYENYKVLVSDAFPCSILLFTHLEADTLIASASAPTYAFIVSNHQFTASFYEYMQRLETLSDKNEDSIDKYIGEVEKILSK
ncbi:MAG: hypothetical protein K6B41_00460 [Butyrivibrio sp.]|nr:hypothetical protein [Butyrivibrio sp.]